MPTECETARGEVPCYLQPTEFCDFEHPAIRALALELTRDAADESEKAVRLFYCVRDRIDYRLGLHAHPASETLKRGFGSCSNKANLLVALARAAGIPAGFRVLHVWTKKYFGPLCFEEFHKHLSDRSLHVLADLYLDGKWLRCDPSDDIRLSEGTAHLNPQSRPVDFDGKTEALLNLTAEHIYFDDQVCHRDIDEVLSKTRRCTKPFLNLLARYLDFLREQGPLHANLNGIRLAFLGWLSRHFPEDYQLLQQGSR